MRKKNIHQVFAYYNRKYFDGKLRISGLSFAPLRSSTMGETTFYDEGHPSIKINKVLTNFGSYARIVLLHEMVHVSFPQHVEHTPRFRRRIKKLVKQGAYDNLL